VIDPGLGQVDVVANRSRPLSSKYLMVNAFGFGGNNAVMVISGPGPVPKS
jgi:3-oxoacyl-(acyl-carrier-protein) synthase